MKHRITIEKFIRRLSEAGILTMWDGDRDMVIEDIQYDSRKVGPKSLFLCKGATFEPSYITKARENGATAYLAIRPFEEGDGLTAIIVSDIRLALAIAADVFFESPWKKLHMIGVTGTKGKSTTVALLKDIFDAHAKKNGLPMAGLTSSARIFDGKVDEPAKLTTPENIDLYRHLDNAVDSGIQTMIVEVSSQALKYHRVGCIHFDDVLFLNIAPDHIGDIEHPDFEDYFASKRMIFDVAKRAFVCTKTDRLDDVLASAKKCALVTFAVEGRGDYTADAITTTEAGMHFTLHHKDAAAQMGTAMRGRFNVENALAASAIALENGVALATIQEVLAQMHLAGHMVYRHSQDGVTVIIDYAHNDISFRKVIETAEIEYAGAPLWFVFGSAGSKAQSRRPDLGQISSRHAARIYLVPDDPAKENVLDINKEISDHFVREVDFVSLADRETGIRDAILSAEAGTVILLLGKGSETAQKGPQGPEAYAGDVPLAEKYLAIRDGEGAKASDFFADKA